MPTDDPILFQLFRVGPSKAERTKLRILEAAIDCMSTIGVERTTFDAIARRAKIAKSHVAYHFPDKRDIFLGSIRYVTLIAQSITVEEVRKATGWHQRILAVLDGALHWMRDYPRHLPVLVHFYQACTIHSDLRKMHTEIRKAGRERLRAVLSSAGSGGEAEEVAELIQNLITGALLEYGTIDSGRSLKRLREVTARGIGALLREHGYRVPK